ncbi:MAG: hypothetical protein JWN52_7136, partial [Actinomycetia bacterium]|nr:hypothetical protein [Actinomycetes bacterium]
MGFQQLYYTSCTNGLAGYGGYQFNAATPGVSPVVMREVENRTVYEPPRGLPAEPRPEELADYPVAFSYTTGGATGAAVTAHVVFVGADYSGRPGNYFAHVLVTDSPEADFGPLLPAELWGAALWRREPVERRELPELSGPPPRGPIDRAGTQAFLDARAADGVLPALLSAVDRAMTGDRAVLLAGHDAAENAWWIAAISYLLGDRLARRLSFTTYSHRPGYSGHHVVGVVNEPGSAPAGADLGFHLFDVAAGRLPDGLGVHPLAELLTRVGVMSSAALWQQAAALATGAETDFTGWYPPVAAAAALLGVEPTVTDVDLIAGWLATADRPPGRHADVVLGVVLARPDDLGDARLRELLDLAVRLSAGGRVERIERLLIDRALGRLGRGEPAEPARLSTPGNRAAAARRCRELLV